MMRPVLEVVQAAASGQVTQAGPKAACLAVGRGAEGGGDPGGVGGGARSQVEGEAVLGEVPGGCDRRGRLRLDAAGGDGRSIDLRRSR
jgi:hypothetical protein